MKICVFSDSHGQVRNMEAAIGLEKPDMCFFLGDGERDLDVINDLYPSLPVYNVKGNCDFMSDANTRLVRNIDGVRIYATHGHRDNVKLESEYRTLEANAREAGADIALFGHTHIQYFSQRGDLTIINPGSIGYGTYAGYAVIETDNGKFTADVKAI